jgi:hypothetical protein
VAGPGTAAGELVGVAAGVSQFVHQTGRGVHDLHALANQNLNKMAAGVLKLGDRQACWVLG